MIRGRTTAAGDVEFYDEASGDVVFEISADGAGALTTTLATTTDPEDGATVWNDDGVLKVASTG